MKTTTARQHRPGSEETVVGSLRELLRGLIDYAGLFPPARLDMAATVDRYAQELRGSEAWMVGRIIIPAGRLDEFEEHAGALFPRDAAAEPWRVSALTAPAGAVAKSRRSGEGCPGSDAFAKPRFRLHR